MKDYPEEFIEQYNASYPEEKEWVAIYPEQIQAIQGFLDLYNKEKEKNKELLYKYKKNGRVLFSEDAVKERHISKDKIREFIKNELPDNEIIQCCETYDSNGVYLRKKLEELLEE